MTNSSTSPNKPVQAIVTRRFAALAERVFDAWLDPNKIHGFLFGSHLRDEEVVALELDPQIGGRFTFSVRRQGQQIDHVGEYLELEHPRRLVFTWGVAQDGSSSRVAIDITPLDDSCQLTLTHDLDPVWAAYVEQSRQGWAKMVDALDALLAKQKAWIMQQRVNIITVLVDDLQKSLAFYRDGLGWHPWWPKPETVDEIDHAAFDLGNGLSFVLYQSVQRAEETGKNTIHCPPTVELAQFVDTKDAVDALCQLAVAAGATIVDPPTDQEWGGYSAKFADLDSCQWEITWNPHYDIIIK